MSYYNIDTSILSKSDSLYIDKLIGLDISCFDKNYSSLFKKYWINLNWFDRVIIHNVYGILTRLATLNGYTIKFSLYPNRVNILNSNISILEFNFDSLCVTLHNLGYVKNVLEIKSDIEEEICKKNEILNSLNTRYCDIKFLENLKSRICDLKNMNNSDIELLYYNNLKNKIDCDNICNLFLENSNLSIDDFSLNYSSRIYDLGYSKIYINK